jgi:acetyltransferase-like isoleucine patch superfamily enzyme
LTNKELLKSRMGQVPLEKEFSGFRAFRSVFFRLLHLMARYLPMYPGWRAELHRLRGVKIGKNVFIGSEVFIDNTYPESIVIEDYVTIISNCFILGHTFTPFHLRKVLGERVGDKRGVCMKKGCYVGARTIVMPGVTIGECSIIGSGSVVTNDIPAFALAMGAPARVTRTFKKEEVLWD